MPQDATVSSAISGFLIAALITLLLAASGAHAQMGEMGDENATGSDADTMSMDMAMDMEPVVDEYSFIAGMIPHHQEAVDTSLLILTNSHRPEMQTFAWGIVKAQAAEIALMNGWLGAWYAERDGEARYAPMMRELRTLSADELDRIFLEDMILHHRGAVMMSRALLDDDLAEHPEVARLARDIIAAQETEIAQMEAWLDAWY